MHPNRDEIIAAKRVLADAGYVCIHVTADAAWAVDHLRDIGEVGVAIQTTEIVDAHRQIMTIKRAYDPSLSSTE